MFLSPHLVTEEAFQNFLDDIPIPVIEQKHRSEVTFMSNSDKEVYIPRCTLVVQPRCRYAEESSLWLIFCYYVYVDSELPVLLFHIPHIGRATHQNGVI
ncbi:hypothetical protein TNIN_148501 [Trichonephila inaurata madagascariensis]|uniref:Uncharacterized protein n=1 Tax=Trichonephila inaurata madagascariensis TaxID=2747483 RepID=A0A8X7CKN3_9ARAC|nr:hypothetical protein TNIN_148501 [Trichonephila inaurata madagascariensis]